MGGSTSTLTTGGGGGGSYAGPSGALAASSGAACGAGVAADAGAAADSGAAVAAAAGADSAAGAGAAADVSAGAGAAGGGGVCAPHPASSRTMEITVYRMRTCSNIGISCSGPFGPYLKGGTASYSCTSHDDVQRASHRSRVNYTIGRFRRYGQITRSTHHEGCARGTSRHGRRDADGRALLRPCSLSALRRQ
jgi:hypothetical protein